MADKIRLGFVGANVRATWASQSHFPALLASPDVELTGVCTTRPESAEEARAALGAKLAFDDFRAMAASPEIDAVVVVVRVPSHYEPTRAAIEAGKHVFTEWPLGRTTAEAEERALPQLRMMARLRMNKPLRPLETVEEAQSGSAEFDGLADSIIAGTRSTWFVGEPAPVAAELRAFAERWEVDEVMVSPVAAAREAEPMDASPGRTQTLELLAAQLSE